VSIAAAVVVVVAVGETFLLVLERYCHWGKDDDRNCYYGHPKMADVESGKNLFC
jgi:hypothetical protein